MNERTESLTIAVANRSHILDWNTIFRFLCIRQFTKLMVPGIAL